METVKKYSFWGIFISIVAIFGMSHNVFAADLPFDISNYTYSQLGIVPNHDCVYGNNSTDSNVQYCANTTSNLQTVIKAITTHNEYTVKKYDYVVFYLTVWNTGNATSAFNLIPTAFSPNTFRLISMQEVVGDIYESAISGTIGGVQYDQLDMNVYSMSQKYIRFVYQASADYTGRIGLYTTSSTGVLTGPSLTARIYGLGYYRKNAETSQNEEQEQKTQEAVDASETAGGESSTDAQTGTTGLISAIGSAVNVISSASPTNCRINGNMGNLDMGQLDLCANPAPAFIQTIGSLILILMCVPLAISLFNRFIALFRSFQN